MYAGQLWLPDFGLYRYKARAYHPGLGRFVQTDPVGYEQGMNLYAYVGLDPMNRTDPTGMIFQDNPSPGASCDPNAPITECDALREILERATDLPDVEIRHPRNRSQPRVGIGLAQVAVSIYGVRQAYFVLPIPYIYFSQSSNSDQSSGSGQEPNRGDLKRVTDYRLQEAARRDGYNRVEDWKTQELGLNSRSDIYADPQGNLYALPRQGRGTAPQPLGVRI